MIGAHVAGFPALVVDRLLARHLDPFLPAMTSEERTSVLAMQEQVRQSAEHFRSVRDAGSGTAAVRSGANRAQSAANELGVSEAMELLGLRARQVRYLAERWQAVGLARKVGRSWLIDRAAVELHAEDRRRCA